MLHDKSICGLDEVGRGPLAGPVVASAVILKPNAPIGGLADSKTLSEKRRESLIPFILENALAYGLGWVWNHEIDELNIHHASLEAMKRAWEELNQNFSLPDADWKILVDGKFTPDLGLKCEAVIKGDGKVAAIAAASILAKVARDRWMERMEWVGFDYGFSGHKGYPTKKHKEAILMNGPSVLHRMSFRLE